MLNIVLLSQMALDTYPNHVREIKKSSIGPVEGCNVPNCQLYVYTVQGSAFLYHQVRYMAAILLLVGQGLETPNIVEKLLDIKQVSAKPQYAMAPEAPLLFNGCGFRTSDLEFRQSESALAKARTPLQDILEHHLVIGALCHQMLLGTVTRASAGGPSNNSKPPKHIPILERQREPSMEERLEREQCRSSR